MKRWIGLVIAVIAAGLILGFAPPARAREAVELLPGKSAPPFHSKIWVLFDKTHKMRLEDARAQPERFRRNQTEQINFGITGDVMWLRFDVINAGLEQGEWLLNTLMRSAVILDFYLLRDSRPELLFSVSRASAASAALREHDMLAAAFRLAPGESATLYVRYLNQNITRIPLQITTPARAAEIRRENMVIFTITAASVAAFAIYSATIFMLIGGRAILYYAIAEIGMLLLLANFDGILSIEAGAYTAIARRVAPAIYSAMVLIFAALFARNFFPLKTQAPRTDLCVRIFLGASLAYLAATLLSAGTQQAFNLVQIAPYILLAVLWLFLPLLAVFASFRWDAGYWPLIPGFFSVLFAHGYWILVVQNLVPEPPFPPRLLGFNFVIQGFFMAFAVVLRVRALRDSRLRAEIGLNQALRQQLAEASRNTAMLRDLAEVGRLMQTAGHDARSMLYSLRGIASGLRKNADALTAQAGEQINYLTDDLEAVFSTTMAGAVTGGHDEIVALENISLGGVFSALRLIHEQPLSAKGLRFSLRGGAHRLVTDRALLLRILGNLIDNARKYTPHGGVAVAARRHGGVLRLQVWDTGCGIEAGLLALLLDPDAGRMRGGEMAPGQGSGLQTVKLLARRLGGRLDACSRPGHGSRFELLLPVTPAGRIPDAACLWILDDDPERARQLRAMAQQLGMETDILAGPDFDAGAITANDLALIDMHFGGREGGVRAATRLRPILPRNHILIATYDQGVDTRARLTSIAGAILYQPITRPLLEFALKRGV